MANAAPLMSGLDHRGRAIEALPSDAPNIPYEEAVRQNGGVDPQQRNQAQDEEEQEDEDEGHDAKEEVVEEPEQSHQDETEQEAVPGTEQSHHGSDKENEAPAGSPTNDPLQGGCTLSRFTREMTPSPSDHYRSGSEADNEGNGESSLEGQSGEEVAAVSVPSSEAETEVVEAGQAAGKRRRNESDEAESDSPQRKRARVANADNDSPADASSGSEGATQPSSSHNLSSGSVAEPREGIEESNNGDAEDDGDTPMSDAPAVPAAPAFSPASPVAPYAAMSPTTEATDSSTQGAAQATPSRNSDDALSKSQGSDDELEEVRETSESPQPEDGELPRSGVEDDRQSNQSRSQTDQVSAVDYRDAIFETQMPTFNWYDPENLPDHNDVIAAEEGHWAQIGDNPPASDLAAQGVDSSDGDSQPNHKDVVAVADAALAQLGSIPSPDLAPQDVDSNDGDSAPDNEEDTSLGHPPTVNGDGLPTANGGGPPAANGDGTPAVNGDGTPAVNGDGLPTANGYGTPTANGGGPSAGDSDGNDPDNLSDYGGVVSAQASSRCAHVLILPQPAVQHTTTQSAAENSQSVAEYRPDHSHQGGYNPVAGAQSGTGETDHDGTTSQAEYRPSHSCRDEYNPTEGWGIEKPLCPNCRQLQLRTGNRDARCGVCRRGLVHRAQNFGAQEWIRDVQLPRAPTRAPRPPFPPPWVSDAPIDAASIWRRPISLVRESSPWDARWQTGGASVECDTTDGSDSEDDYVENDYDVDY